MKFTYVHEGKVSRAFDSLPESWAGEEGVDKYDKQRLERLGIYEILDSRPLLPSFGYNYTNQKLTFSNGVVTLTADVVPPSPPTQQEQDEQAARQYSKLVALKSMSPEQVRSWVTANVNNLADAKDVITTLAIAVALLARRI